MGLFIAIIVLFLIMGILCYFLGEKGFSLKKLLNDYLKYWGIIGLIISAFICFCGVLVSYTSYIDLCEVYYSSKVATQKELLQTYKEGVKAFQRNGTLTDNSEEAYYNMLSNKIYDIECTITHYNTIYSGKYTLNKNLLLKGLIVLPDKDMTLL